MASFPPAPPGAMYPGPPAPPRAPAGHAAAAAPPMPDVPAWGRFGELPPLAPPMPPLPKWTALGEQELRKLDARREELLARRTLAIQKVREAFDGVEVRGGLDVDAAIRRAEAIRDALAPFDSGTRPDEAAR